MSESDKNMSSPDTFAFMVSPRLFVEPGAVLSTASNVMKTVDEKLGVKMPSLVKSNHSSTPVISFTVSGAGFAKT